MTPSAKRPWEHDTHFCFPCDYVTTDKALMNAHATSAEHLERARDWPKRLWERFEPENPIYQRARASLHKRSGVGLNA